MINVLLQQLVNGLMAGSTYALIGLGLTLIYGVMELSNFAHGEFAMIGGYMAFFIVMMKGGSYFEALLFAAIAGVVIGMAVNVFAFDTIKKGNSINLMISSLGVSTLLVNLAQYLFTANPRRVTTVYAKQIYQIGPISVTGQRVLVMVIALLLSFGVYFIIKKTKFGRAIRATSMDANTAQLYGINTEKVAFLTFLLGTGLASIAGALMGPLFNVYPTMGLSLTTKSFVVVVLGGMGSIPGAILGGIIIGLVESMGSVISTRYVDLFVYLILFIVLIVKPQGIFKKYRREKV